MTHRSLTPSDSQMKRLESKKRKIAAFLALAELNDGDVSQPTHQKPTDEPEDTYQMMKKRLKSCGRLRCYQPEFSLKSVGHYAEFDTPDTLRKPLLLKDLNEMLLFALMGGSSASRLRWCTLTQWRKLSHVVFFILEEGGVKHGLSTSSIFQFKLDFMTPKKSDVVEDFANLPVYISGGLQDKALPGSGLQLRCIFPIKGQEVHQECSGDELPLKLRLLLSVRQMMDEDYPLPLDGPWGRKCESFVFTSDQYEDVSEKSPLFSIDCEMVRTQGGLQELAKICVVNERLEVVLESMVKPKNPVINYLTKFSGITEQSLRDVDVTLEDVQSRLRSLLPADAILVGHSLCNDLKAMQMIHPYIIDTSVIFCLNGSRNLKSKLSHLSESLLNESIQTQASGHDPKEDATAAMKLVQLKLSRGQDFGDVLWASRSPVTDTASPCTKKASTLCIVSDRGQAKRWPSFPGISVHEMDSAEEAVMRACEVSCQFDFIVCHVNVSQSCIQPSSIAQWTSTLSSSVSQNGLFVALSTANEAVVSHQETQGTARAFVGITLKKPLTTRRHRQTAV